MHSYIKYLLIIIAICVQGCSIEHHYETPTVELSEEWKNEDKSEGCACEPAPDRWWEIFNDPYLDCLETQAVAASPNLQSAYAKLQEAEARARAAYSELFPKIDFNPALVHAGILRPSLLAPPPSPIIPAGPERIQVPLYLLPFSASYNLDLWGQYRLGLLSDEAYAEAQMYQMQDAWLKLTAQVASSYFAIRAYDAQLEVLYRTIEMRKEALKLNTIRNQKGLTSEISVAQADLEVSTVQLSIDETQRLRAIAEDALAALIGLSASCFDVPSSPLQALPPCPPVVLPSTMLRQRPDLYAAERLLFSSFTDIAVAETAYYPSVTLSGDLGLVSTIASELFKWKARLWAYAVRIAQTVFDAGNIQANVDEAKARYLQQVANYEQAVLQSFQQVEDALANVRSYRLQYAHLQEAEEKARRTYSLTQNRYRGGLSNYLDVVDAERNVLNEQLNAANALGQQYAATIALIQAIGGTWSTSPTEELCTP